MTKRILISTVAFAAMLAAPHAMAQAAPADNEKKVDVIVVTAQKREERLQDVPVAISVLSGDAIAERGSLNLEGAQYLAACRSWP